MTGRGVIKKCIAFTGSYLLMSSIMANPVVDTVAAGNVSIEQTSHSTVVNQTSQQAIINWQSFNIGQQESTHFQQPAGGVALNRINPSEGPSSIYGRLTATGQIILINPAGIYFGPTAVVNVGGLIASTATMSDHDFLNGYYHFSSVSPSASIRNDGQLIAANNGLIALIGGSVENNGTIQANLGHVVLASGDAFTMNFAGNDLINFSVDSAAQTSPLPNGVKNTGTLIANGGTVLVTAKAAANVLDNVINMQGVAEAQSVNEQPGEIILSSDAGEIYVAANLDASGKLAGQLGGNIAITGYNILIDAPSRIDVSGDMGGGNVNIGGNAHGLGDLPNAHATVMANATIQADAITGGIGGNVVLWSDYFTNVNGDISARGGATSGNGGFVETSSHGNLEVNKISVNVSASNGIAGMWLLDPSDLTISAAANSNVTASSPFTPSTQSSNSILNVSTLTTALGTGNVTVLTTAGAGPGNGDIFVSSNVTWSSAFNLTLSAYRNISSTSNITNTGGASVVLQADNTGTGTGTVSFAATKHVALSGGTGTVSIYYNPTTFGTQDVIYTGGTTPTQYMLINSLGAEADTTTPSLASLSNNNAFWGETFALATNIDATATNGWNGGAGFLPIGDTGTNFTGALDGQNYTISNLYMNRSTSGVSEDYGMFGTTGASVISNLRLTNAALTYANDTFLVNVGLLAGLNAGTITNVYGSGSVTVNYTDQLHRVGGLIGRNDGAITNAYSNINLTDTTTTANGGTVIGGLLALNAGTISSSYSAGSVTENMPAGSLTLIYIGGFVGENQSTISNSYTTANVNVASTGALTDTQIGGFNGVQNGGTVDKAYSTGIVTVTGTPVNLGGFIGSNATGTVSNSFWDTTTSGISAGYGANTATVTNLFGGCFGSTACGTITNATNAGGAGKNMSTQAPYQTDAGWNFSSTWAIINTQSYPYLQAFYASTPRAISGTSSLAANTAIKLANNGSAIDSTTTGNNGFFYLLEGNNAISGVNNSIANGDDLLIYATGGNSNVVAVAPNANGSLSGTTQLALTANTLTMGVSGLASTLSNSAANTAKGSLVDADILYSVSGGNLTVSNGINFLTFANTTYNLDGNINASSSNMTFNGPISVTAASPSLTTTTSGGITIANTVDGGSNAFTLATAGSSSITGAMSNLTGFTKSGAGTLTVSSLNTYAGTTTINSGTLTLGIANALPTTTALSNSGTLNLAGFAQTVTGITGSGNVTSATATNFTVNNTAADSYAGTLSGSLALIKTGAGALALSNSNTYSNGTTVSGGTLSISNVNALGSGAFSLGSGTSFNLDGITYANAISLNNADLSFTNNGSVTGAITLGVGTSNTITANAGSSFTIANTIDGAGDLTIQGTGALTLNNAIGGSSPLTSITVSNATTTINGGSITTTGNQTYNGLMTLGSTTTLTATSSNPTIAINNGIAGGQNLTLGGGVSSNSTYTINGTLTANNITVNGNAATNNTFSLTSASTSTWTLSSSNSGTISGVAGITGAFSFNNIQSIISSPSASIVFPASKANQLIISGANTGSLVDPVIFNGFNTFYSQNANDTVTFPDGTTFAYNGNYGTATVNGSSMYFYGYPVTIFVGSTASVSQIIQQPDTSSTNNSLSSSNVNTQTDTGLVTLSSDLQSEVSEDFQKLTITAFCAAVP